MRLTGLKFRSRMAEVVGLTPFGMAVTATLGKINPCDRTFEERQAKGGTWPRRPTA